MPVADAPAFEIDKAELFRRLEYEPHPAQQTIHDSHAKRRVIACGVRFGKSKAAGMEALAAALEPKKFQVGWVVAPTYGLSDKVFREIRHAVHEHFQGLVLRSSESEQMIRMTNLGGGITEIWGRSADNPVSLLGEGVDWMIVDEASRIRPQVWEGHLSQRLIDKDGWSMLISTPKGKNWFYREWMRGEHGEVNYANWRHPSWSNPHLKRELIDQQRVLIPEALFSQEYEAAFMEGAGSVFRNVEDCAAGELYDGMLPRDDSSMYYAGLDLAKVEDFTVLTIIRRPEIEKREVRVKGQIVDVQTIDDPIGKPQAVYVDRYHRQDWAVMIQRAKAGLEKFGNPICYVDSTGVGEPIYEALLEHGVRAEPYPFTNRSKANLVNALAILFEQKGIVIPRRDLFPHMAEELEAFEYSITDSGNVKTGAPSSMHDDTVISLALAAWPVSQGHYQIFSKSV